MAAYSPFALYDLRPQAAQTTQPSIWQALSNPSVANVISQFGNALLQAGAPAPLSAGPGGYRFAQAMSQMPQSIMQQQLFQHQLGQDKLKQDEIMRQGRLSDLQIEDAQRKMQQAMLQQQAQGKIAQALGASPQFADNPILQALSSSGANLDPSMFGSLLKGGISPAPNKYSYRTIDDNENIYHIREDKSSGKSDILDIIPKGVSPNIGAQEEASRRLSRESFDRSLALESTKKELKDASANKASHDLLNNAFSVMLQNGGKAPSDPTQINQLQTLREASKIDPSTLSGDMERLKLKMISTGFDVSAKAGDTEKDSFGMQKLPIIQSEGQAFYVNPNSNNLTSLGSSDSLNFISQKILNLSEDDRNGFFAGKNRVRDSNGVDYIFDTKLGTLRILRK